MTDLKCDKCGCHYGQVADLFGTEFYFEPGQRCGDHRCACGAPDCYEKHSCDGIKHLYLRLPDEASP